MKFKFLRDFSGKTNGLVMGVFQENILTSEATHFNTLTGGAIERALKASSFKGKVGQSLSLLAPHGLDVDRIILVGLGEKDKGSPHEWEEIGGHIYQALIQAPSEEVTLMLPQASLGKAAYGVLLRSWRFDKYKTKKKDDNAIALKTVSVISPEAETAEADFKNLSLVAEGVFLTRMVVSEPANVIYPETMVEQAKKLKEHGVHVEILDEKEMKRLGMGALLGVGQGSNKDSYLIVLSWNGGQKGKAPVAIVGKGVTFDSGGISIKPATNVEDMRWDMGGSAVVLGLMKTLALRKAPVNVVGVMGMVENVPSGTAQRPGDIVTSMSGQTIEVINTDAEGRLVLADALWYTQNRFKPAVMIDLATLTGAIIVCLGQDKAGVFSNNEGLAKQLVAASEEVGEPVWHLPLSKIGEGYDKEIDTPAADVKNVGSGRGAGSITAAQFLQRFVNDVPWAHLDIAGVVWETKIQKPLSAKGATGFGVRLLNQYIKMNHEG